MQHFYVELYINYENHALGVKNYPTSGVIGSHRLTMVKNKKKTSPKSQGTELHISMVVLFINPANRAPGVNTGFAPGVSLSVISL